MVISCGACGYVGEASISPGSPSFRGTWGKRSRSAQRIVHISTGRAPAPFTEFHTPSFSRAAFPYFPAGTLSGSAMARCPPLSAPAQLEPQLDVELQGSVCWRNDDKPVAEKGFAACRLNEIALLQVIHPIKIRRDEHVGRGAAFDLLCKRRTRRIGDFGGIAGLSGVDPGRFIEGFFE